MKKRIVSFLLALVMAVSLLPVSAFAVEDTASPDVPAVVEPEAQTAGEQQDERAGKQTETSAFAAEDAPAVKFTYSPPDSEVKVIGTYQVDEDTTWNVRLVTVNSTKYNCIQTHRDTETGVISTEMHKVGDTVTPDNYVMIHHKGSDTYESGIRLYDQMKGHLNLTDADALESTATQTCFYNFKIKGRPSKATVKEICGLLIIQWTAGEFVAPDKTKLQEAIENAPTAASGNYYTTGDKFNGKNTSQKGFWADYQSVLQAANKTNEDASATQERIDNAVAELGAAIDNLIPTTQVNATALYEALNTKWCWQGEDHMLSTVGDPVSADNCTTLSWQP